MPEVNLVTAKIANEINGEPRDEVEVWVDVVGEFYVHFNPPEFLKITSIYNLLKNQLVKC